MLRSKKFWPEITARLYTPIFTVTMMNARNALKTKSSQLHEHQFGCEHDEQQCDNACRAEHRCSVCRKTRAETLVESAQQDKEDLCIDEGCPHHGTPHVCITRVAQPQLPPMDGEYKSAIAPYPKAPPVFILKEACNCRERQLLVALAENESLKAQIKDRSTETLYIPKAWYDTLKTERDKLRKKVYDLQLAFAVSDAPLPKEFEPDLPPTKRLHAYIDKALEALRKYRVRARNSQGVCAEDNRCPTCIKADALLSREKKD